MLVADILQVKGDEVVTIDKDRRVADALTVLHEHGIGALVVTNGSKALEGMFSERDVVRALAREHANALDLQVADLMSSDVTTCETATSVTALMGVMTSRRIRHVPVLEDGDLRGLISIGDVVKARLDELEQEKKELLDYVSAR